MKKNKKNIFVVVVFSGVGGRGGGWTRVMENLKKNIFFCVCPFFRGRGDWSK